MPAHRTGRRAGRRRRRLLLPFRAVAAARGVLLGRGTDVEVAAPPELRIEMAATALAVVRLYARTAGGGLSG